MIYRSSTRTQTTGADEEEGQGSQASVGAQVRVLSKGVMVLSSVPGANPAGQSPVLLA